MTISSNLQGAPPWLNKATQELVDRSRQLNAEPYTQFRKVSPERNHATRNEIARLIELQRGNQFDIIPFSITGSSEPININPDDLRNIIQDEVFARRAYEAATGFHNVSRDELRNLQQRAAQRFEASLPEIRQFEEQRRPQPLYQQEQGRKIPAPNRKVLGNEIFQIKLREAQLRSQIQNNPQMNDADKRSIRLDLKQLALNRKQFEEEFARVSPAEAEARPLAEQRRIDNKEAIRQLRMKDMQAQNAMNAPSQAANRHVHLAEHNRLNKQISDLERQHGQIIPVAEAAPEPQRRNISPAAEEAPEPQRRAIPPEEQAEISNRIYELRNQEEAISHEPGPPGGSFPGNAPDTRKKRRNNIRREIESLEARRSGAPIERQIPSEAAEFPQPQRRSIPLDLLGRASIEREIKNLQSQNATIAPMNETHGRVKDMMLRGFDDDSMDLASSELQKASRHNELGVVEPLVRASIEGPTDEYMDKYVNDYTKDIRKALEDESEEEYLKKIAPKINMSFSQMGAFHSGARAKALKDASDEHRTKLRREIAHLTGTARDKAMEHHELQKRRQQTAAHQLGATTKSQKESHGQQAELHRHQAITRQSLNQMNASALGQIAEAEQKQAQNEIESERQELARQRQHPIEQNERQAAILAGLPAQPSQTFTSEHTKILPPNYFTQAAGHVANLASQFGQPQQKKGGGSVRKKYASGGSIGSDEIGNEIRKIIQEQGQAGQAHIAQTSQQNPMQDWLRHVGREMLNNPNEDPLLSLGRGSSAALDHKELMRERSANLYDKIQATKLSQYKVLAEYQNMKEKNSLARDTLKETGRYHDIMGNLQAAKFSAPPKKTSIQQKLEDKAMENIIENDEMKNDLNLIENAIQKERTGPLIGPVKSFIGMGNEIDVLGNHIVTKANKLYGRGGGSNLQLKTLQGGKPGQNLSKKANETIIKKYREESDRRIKKNTAYLLKAGWTPEEISAATGAKLYNDAEVEGEEINNEYKPSSNVIVNMIDPNGNPLKVPEDQVDHAISLGAHVVE